MVEKTYKEYQGYYYEFKGKIFAGEKFKENSLLLVPISKDGSNSNNSSFNQLLTRAATYVYGKVSKTKVINNTVSSFTPLESPTIESIIDRDPSNDFILNNSSFYCKKINDNIIKEIDENTYLLLQLDPLYLTAIIGKYRERLYYPEDAEKNIPGIIDWLSFLPLDTNNIGSTC